MFTHRNIFMKQGLMLYLVMFLSFSFVLNLFAAEQSQGQDLSQEQFPEFADPGFKVLDDLHKAISIAASTNQDSDIETVVETIEKLNSLKVNYSEAGLKLPKLKLPKAEWEIFKAAKARISKKKRARFFWTNEQAAFVEAIDRAIVTNEDSDINVVTTTIKELERLRWSINELDESCSLSNEQRQIFLRAKALDLSLGRQPSQQVQGSTKEQQEDRKNFCGPQSDAIKNFESAIKKAIETKEDSDVKLAAESIKKLNVLHIDYATVEERLSVDEDARQIFVRVQEIIVTEEQEQKQNLKAAQPQTPSTFSLPSLSWGTALGIGVVVLGIVYVIITQKNKASSLASN